MDTDNTRWTYFRLPLIGAIYAEYPSVTRGHRWFDYVSEGGELLVWAGRLHVTFTPASTERRLDRAHG